MRGTYFYQSNPPRNTEVDWKNEDHRKMVELMFRAAVHGTLREYHAQTNVRRRLTRLMRKLGFEPSYDEWNRTLWSSDLCMVHRGSAGSGWVHPWDVGGLAEALGHFHSR